MKLILILSLLVFNLLSLSIGQNNTMGNYEKHTIITEEEEGNIDEESMNKYLYSNYEEPSSIVDRWRLLYEQGKNITIRKNVEHINQTFETLKTFGENIKYLLSQPKESRDKQKAIELLIEMDLGITNECYSALINVFEAFSDKEIWALKCK